MLTGLGRSVLRTQRLLGMPAAVAMVADWEDSWEDPEGPFQEWLRDCVMRAVRGYCQPGKPSSLRREESVQVYHKTVRVVLANERKASLAPPSAHGICLLPTCLTPYTACRSCLSSQRLTLAQSEPPACVSDQSAHRQKVWRLRRRMRRGSA